MACAASGLLIASRATPAPRVTCDPFGVPALAQFLASRAGEVTAGVLDPRSGRLYLYHPGEPEVTASVVTVDILAALLAQAQAAHEDLSAIEAATTASMIEDSNNVAAQELWNQIGGFGLSRVRRGTGGYYAIASFDQRLGLTQTTTNWAWGMVTTTPRDQLRLLAAIFEPSPVLSTSSQDFERSLMQDVIPSQRFGVPFGVPASATVGVKDGWFWTTSTGWQINSIGAVDGGSTDYLAAVMSAHDPSELYGQATVDGVGTLLWRLESQRAATCEAPG